MNRPESFPGFIKHFNQLLDYIAEDERVSNQIVHTPFAIELPITDEWPIVVFLQEDR